MPTNAAIPIPARSARLLLMHAQRLLADPASVPSRGRLGGPAATAALIRDLGFVQLDTITTVERAHDHILHTRSDAFTHAHLAELQARKGLLFEHMTHDASLIPTEWFQHWRRRYDPAKIGPWLRSRLGPDAQTVLQRVRDHIREHGPCRVNQLHAAQREKGAKRSGSGGWWEWTPQKAALEYLWRVGELSVCARENFHKVYDLAQRVHPEAHARPPPPLPAHIAWACAAALDRLGAAAPSELSAFWKLVTPAQAAAWTRAAEKSGEVIPVLIHSVDGSAPRRGVARPDLRERLAALPDAPPGARLLSPFDPVIRDRKRLARLFGVEYRFEAFVPAAKRRYGYYVLPVLEGDRIVARVDAKLHRERAVLELRGLWWEPGVKPAKARRAALQHAAERYAAFAGASGVEYTASAAVTSAAASARSRPAAPSASPRQPSQDRSAPRPAC